MPTLRDLHALLLGSGLSPETVEKLFVEMRRAFPGDKVYIPPLGTRKDTSRQDVIRRLAKTLPTGVICERLGLSRSYVHRVLKVRK